MLDFRKRAREVYDIIVSRNFICDLPAQFGER